MPRVQITLQKRLSVTAGFMGAIRAQSGVNVPDPSRPRGRAMGKSVLKPPRESGWTAGPLSVMAKDLLPTKHTIAGHSLTVWDVRCKSLSYHEATFTDVKLFSQQTPNQAAFPSKSPTQNTASPKGCFFLLLMYHLLAESALQQGTVCSLDPFPAGASSFTYLALLMPCFEHMNVGIL